MRVLGICLSDIPKSQIKQGKDGKYYVNIVETEMKQVDNYGHDLTVFMQQSKEERLNQIPKTYIGKGKTYQFGQQQQQTPSTEDIENMPQSDGIDDLPF